MNIILDAGMSSRRQDFKCHGKATWQGEKRDAIFPLPKGEGARAKRGRVRGYRLSIVCNPSPGSRSHSLRARHPLPMGEGKSTHLRLILRSDSKNRVSKDEAYRASLPGLTRQSMMSAVVGNRGNGNGQKIRCVSRKSCAETQKIDFHDAATEWSATF